MPRVSAILASRNETYLRQTVEDLLHNARGDVEVLVGYDGPPYTPLPDDPRVKAFRRDVPSGLKPVINMLAHEAQGDYLLKCDAHCAFSPGWDVLLAGNIEWNWMVVPRFYTLDAERWRWQSDRFNDLWLLDCPLTDPRGYRFKAGGYWWDRTAERAHIGPMDETMTHHGSCWFVGRDFFVNHLGGMVIEGYGASYMEPADLGLRVWLGPWEGKCMVNKTVWYAHAHKGRERPRGYGVSMREINRSYRWTAEHWMRNKWKQQAKPLAWLIELFAPIPSAAAVAAGASGAWPADWQARQLAHEAAHPWDEKWGPQCP